MVDWLPVLSQSKSLILYVGGDSEGAHVTQINFLNRCPGISQVKSLVEASNSDYDAAHETQEDFLENLSNVVDCIPVVGHLKGGGHCICGDPERGAESVKSATRTIGITAGGLAGVMVAGPPGAAAGGVLAGVASDALLTGLGTVFAAEYMPYGYFSWVPSAWQDELTLSEYVDAAFGTMIDAFSGFLAGRAYNSSAVVKASMARCLLRSCRVRSVRVTSAVTVAETGSPHSPSRSRSQLSFGVQKRMLSWRVEEKEDPDEEKSLRNDLVEKEKEAEERNDLVEKERKAEEETCAPCLTPSTVSPQSSQGSL